MLAAWAPILDTLAASLVRHSGLEQGLLTHFVSLQVVKDAADLQVRLHGPTYTASS